jgi:hypothetical protein
MALATIMDKIGVPSAAPLGWTAGLPPAAVALLRAAGPLIESEDRAGSASSVSSASPSASPSASVGASPRLARQVPPATAAAALDLLAQLLRYSPVGRPTAEEALQHAFFGAGAAAANARIPVAAEEAEGQSAANAESAPSASSSASSSLLRAAEKRIERCRLMEHRFTSSSSSGASSPSSMLSHIRRELWAEIDGPL